MYLTVDQIYKRKTELKFNISLGIPNINDIKQTVIPSNSNILINIDVFEDSL